MKHLSNEIGKHGVTVNCVAPALIETPHRSGAGAYSAKQIEKRRRMNVMQRLGLQDELCAVVCFLASAKAGFVTGELIRVDGGLAISPSDG